MTLCNHNGNDNVMDKSVGQGVLRLMSLVTIIVQVLLLHIVPFKTNA